VSGGTSGGGSGTRSSKKFASTGQGRARSLTGDTSPGPRSTLQRWLAGVLFCVPRAFGRFGLPHFGRFSNYRLKSPRTWAWISENVGSADGAGTISTTIALGG
jgi:hypothetical protein